MYYLFMQYFIVKKNMASGNLRDVALLLISKTTLSCLLSLEVQASTKILVNLSLLLTASFSSMGMSSKIHSSYLLGNISELLIMREV